MCKILAIINKNKNNSKVINDILKINAGRLQQEQDGYSVVRNKEAFYYLKYNNFLNNIKYNNEKIYLLHLRTATAGAIGYDGLHLKKINNFFYAHNGTVEKFNNADDYNDSYYFFNNLFNKNNNLINKKAIEKEIKETGFFGRGLIYNPDNKELFLFSINEFYVYGLKDCLIFSSFELSLKKTKYYYQNILGLYFIKKTEKKEIKIKKQEFKNIFIKIKNGKVVSLENLEVDYKYKFFNYNFYSNTYYEY